MSLPATMRGASTDNGVIRVGRKGKVKFAFGEDGEPFEVDVVVAFQQWINIDDHFREQSQDRVIKVTDIPEYHKAALEFVQLLATDHKSQYIQPPNITTAEALDFLARLREQYDELSHFFVPKLREGRDSPDSSGAEMRFSVEGN